MLEMVIGSPVISSFSDVVTATGITIQRIM